MLFASIDLGQIITIMILAIALGMDAFSMGIGIGLRGIRYLDILKVSLVVGFFHVIMPFLGMHTGHYAGELLGEIAIISGGGLLALLGLHMLYSSIRGEEMRSVHISTLVGLILFALSVSIDSFSVGISLGLFSTDVLLTIALFGIFGGMMSITGLLIGRRVASWVGDYGEAFGGVILLAFGVKLLIG